MSACACCWCVKRYAAVEGERLQILPHQQCNLSGAMAMLVTKESRLHTTNNTMRSEANLYTCRRGERAFWGVSSGHQEIRYTAQPTNRRTQQGWHGGLGAAIHVISGH